MCGEAGELSQDLGRLDRVEMRLFNTGDSDLEISELSIVDIQGVEVAPIESGFVQTQIHRDWLHAFPLPLVIEPGVNVSVPLLVGPGERYVKIVSTDPNSPLLIPLNAEPNQPPELTLISPASGEIITELSTFVAEVNDDTDLSQDLQMQWLSSVDGMFGNNSPAADGTATAVWSGRHSAGYHSIRLTATDSCMQTTAVLSISSTNGR